MRELVSFGVRGCSRYPSRDRRAPTLRWKSPIFPVPAWRAGQAFSEIWGSTLVTFTMRYPFRTIHIVVLCEGRIIKDSIKLQIITGVCSMVGERTLTLLFAA